MVAPAAALPMETEAMTEPVLVKIGYAVVAVVAYGLLRWRWMRATQDFRIRAGCEADLRADDPHVKPWVRASLAGLADKAYRPMAPWLLLLGLVIVMILPVRKLDHSEFSDDPVVADKVARLKVKLVFGLMSTSPLACVFAAAVLMLGLLTRRSVDVIEERVSATSDRFFHTIGTGRPRSA